MPIPSPQAPQEQGNPYLPPGPEPLICDQFMGINTSTTRAGVDEKQMWWCSGYFPIAPWQLRTLPGIGPILWTTPTSTIVFYGFANIGSNPIAIVFLADGSIWQVRTDTGVATNIAGTNTIVNPSVLTTGMSQWGSQYVLIVNKQTNGYFVWDGTLFYFPGSLAPGVTLTNAGSNYSTAPTVTASGGTGSGATFVATLQALTGEVLSTSVSPTQTNVNRVAVNLFQGLPTSTISFSGGGGSGAAGTLNWQLSGQTSDGLNQVWVCTSVTMTSFGSGYSSAPTVTFIPGNAFIAGYTSPPDSLGFPTFTANVVNVSGVASVTMTNPGSGYSVGDVVTLGFSGGGGTGAAATVSLFPFGVGGTDVETFAQRVWIINGALLQWGAPGAVFNFATSAGGGSTTSNDSFLRVGYTRLIQTNGFLYLIGDSSINYISGVQTTGTPPTTTFTNQNADPEVGTPYPASADVFGRNIVFANSFGAHVSYGAAVTKISEPLDGVYTSIANFNGQQLSAGKAIIFSKKVWVLLVPVVDPATGLNSNELFLWDGGKKWFSSKQDRQLSFINFQEINSVLTCWGTDSASLFPLFQSPSTVFTKTMQTKLWAKPGGYQFNKSQTRFWGAVQYYAGNSQNFNITIDTEYTVQPYTLVPPAIPMNWTTDGITPMVWTTNGVTPMVWTTGALTGIRIFDPLAIGQQGVLNGFTVSTNADDVAIISMSIQPEAVGYRG